jgi:hypothetical protein
MPLPQNSYPAATSKSRWVRVAIVAIFLMGGLVYSAANSEIFAPFTARVTTMSLAVAMSNKKEQTLHAPATVPYAYESFLTDFDITPSKPAFLYGQFPRAVFQIPGVASGTSRQFNIVGAPSASCVALEVEWSSPKDRQFNVSFDIEDRIGRPVFSARGITGLKKVHLRAGIYRIQLRYAQAQAIPEQAHFAMRALEVSECAANTLGYGEAVEDIPIVHISMPLVSKMQFNFFRENHELKLQGKINEKRQGSPIDTTKTRVDATLRLSSSVNKVKVWPAGAGDIEHFNIKSPSMTVEVLSGPLPLGMTRFKLYNLKTKQGLLDFSAGKLFEKEGVFVPRWRLVSLILNNQPAGLYVIEESPTPEFFTAKKRHSASITSLGRRFHKAKGALENPLQDHAFALDIENQRIDPVAFVKTIALISRFHATHGSENTELRSFLNPLSGQYESMVRDINVDYWPRKGLGIRSYLVHGSWWIGDRFYGEGSHQNPKTGKFGPKGFDCPDCIAYKMTDQSLGLAGINPNIITFLRSIKNRTLFEKNLLYYTSEDYFTAIKKQIDNIRKSVVPFYKGNAPLLGKFSYQARDVFSTKMTDSSIANTVRNLSDKAQAIIVPGEESETYRRYFLYNFSPLSLGVKLSDGVMTATNEVGLACSTEQNTTLAPTTLFTQLTNSPELPFSSDTFSRLSARLIRLALNIDKRRFEAEYQDVPFSPGARPYLSFCLPKGKETKLINELRQKGRFLVAGTTVLQKDKILFVDDLPAQPGRIIIEKNRYVDRPIEFPIRDEVFFQQAGQFFIDGGYVFRYLVINQSKQEIRLPIASLEGKPFKGFWNGEYHVTKVVASTLTEDEISNATGELVLQPTNIQAVKKTTGLWIDNLISIVEQPKEVGTSQVAVLDIYISVDKNGVRKPKTSKADVPIIFTKPPHLTYLLERSLPTGHAFRIDEPHLINLWGHSRQGNGVAVKLPTATFSGKTVHLTDERYDEQVIIGADQTLELVPGQRILFGPNAGVLVLGNIQARGTPSAPITLAPTEDKWRGVFIVNDLEVNKVNLLENVTIERGEGGMYENYNQIGSLALVRANAVLTNVTVASPLSPDGVNFYHSRVTANGLKVIDSFDDALDSDWSYVQLSNSQFTMCGGDCVDLNNSHFSISNVTIDQAADKAFTVGEGSTAIINNSTAKGGRVGIAIKDQSYIAGTGNTFKDFSTAPFVAYVKKATFGFPDHNLKNSTYEGKLMKLREGSRASIDRTYD